MLRALDLRARTWARWICMRNTCVRAGAAVTRTSTAWPADRCARRCPSRSATRSAGSASSIRWAIIRSRTTPRRWRNTARCSNRSAARAAAGRARHGAGFYAQFVSYSLEDQVQARALHAQSAAAFPPNRYFGDVDGLFRSFARTSASSTACRTTTAPSGERAGTHVPLDNAGGGGPSLRPLGFRAGPRARSSVAGPRRGAGAGPGGRRFQRLGGGRHAVGWRRP